MTTLILPKTFDLRELEERAIREALERYGTLSEAARALGIDKATLYRKRLALGIKWEPKVKTGVGPTRKPWGFVHGNG